MSESYKVHVTSPTEVILNGKIVELQPDVYNVSNIKFCNENDFIKCDRCKEYFDEVTSLGPYHPKKEQGKEKHYCDKCFLYKYK